MQKIHLVLSYFYDIVMLSELNVSKKTYIKVHKNPKKMSARPMIYWPSVENDKKRQFMYDIMTLDKGEGIVAWLTRLCNKRHCERTK